MRSIIQRVINASVHIDGVKHSSIKKGLLVLLGIEEKDTKEDIEWLSNKIISMRIFSDSDGKMNLALNDVEGECLIVSQFTLHASTTKGNRPSFIKAAHPNIAIPLYENFIENASKLCVKPVQTGVFGADMQIELVNDGPVTIIIDSKNRE